MSISSHAMRGARASVWARASGRAVVVLALVMTGAAAAGAREWRSIDGSGNNVAHPEWGSAGQRLLRLAPVGYADGIARPAGASRPNPRAVSESLCAQSEPTPNAAGATDLFWQWGQFLDHDIDLTRPMADRVEPFPIAVPPGDPFFDPAATGTEIIPLDRSTYDPATGTDRGNPRQQVNEITAFIDASNVYGSDALRAGALRRLDGRGRLRAGRGRLLPRNTFGLPNVGGPLPGLFLAGDVRANEQVGLTAMHVLFVREHNRQAARIRRRAPRLSDTEIYERARAIVGAEMQVITYKEFLPLLLGPDALVPYTGYDPRVNPGVSNAFSTAAFRFGHSMLPSALLRLRRNGGAAAGEPLFLRDAFFSPRILSTEMDLPELFRGLAGQVAQDIDLLIVDEIRNFLFGPPGAGGMDLAALNIQRGRDHGLPDYNTMRVALGLTPAAAFTDITSDPDVAARLAAVYPSVDAVDVWVGGLAEDHVPGALVGELFFTIITDQFERLRDGDRFWYQNVFAGRALAELERTTLARIIRRNTKVGREMPRHASMRR